jgi:hypothetical protein
MTLRTRLARCARRPHYYGALQVNPSVRRIAKVTIGLIDVHLIGLLGFITVVVLHILSGRHFVRMGRLVKEMDRLASYEEWPEEAKHEFRRGLRLLAIGLGVLALTAIATA